MENFFISIFSLFVDGSLLNDLRIESLILPLGFTILFIPIVAAFIFYIVINSVKFNKKRHWLLTLFVAVIFCILAFYITCIQEAEKQILKDPDNPNSGYLFDQGDAFFLSGGIGLGLASIITFVLFSLFFKNLPKVSSNTRRTPF